jgi:small nuclear ribonucleoprotein (snRNP)-like protein
MLGDTVTGALKGYDALMNLVLDEVEEVMRGEFSLHPYEP